MDEKIVKIISILQKNQKKIKKIGDVTGENIRYNDFMHTNTGIERMKILAIALLLMIVSTGTHSPALWVNNFDTYEEWEEYTIQEFMRRDDISIVTVGD